MTADDLLDLAATGRIAELRQALAEAPPTAAESLVLTLAERSAAQALADLDAAPVPPAVRKRVRAALHALRVRGIPTPATARVARLPPAPAAEAAAEAWIAAPPPGVHLVLVPRDASGRRLLVALLDEQERVVDGGRMFHAFARDVREMIERGPVGEAAGDAPFVPLPPGHVAERLRAAVRRPPSPYGSDAAASRADLAEALAAEETLADAPHPARELAPADLHERARAAAVLTFSPRDLPFTIARPSIASLVERLNALLHSPLVLAPDLQTERQREVLRTFVERDLPPELVAGLGLRLLDRAWVRRSRDAEAARASAAAGMLLLERPTSPAAREVLCAFVLAHLRLPAPEDGDTGSAGERRRRGGLILP